jgi:hypothetical protein
MADFTDAELDAYLDEGLDPERTAQIEKELRDEGPQAEQLAGRIRTLVGQRDAGVHTLGGIWRSHRLSCPSRQELGSFLLGVLEPAHAEYVRFHLESIGCRPCAASLTDLKEQHASTNETEVATRRKKYYQTSAGYLSNDS